MSQVSKNKLDPRVEEKITALFPIILSRLCGRGKSSVVIETLFSASEQTMLSKRIAISFMLVKGYTYHQIMHKLKVSLGTVAKVAEITKKADKTYTDELIKISKEEHFSELMSTIGYHLDKVLPPKGGNWREWRRKIEKDKTSSQQPF